MSALTVENLSIGFGGLTALDDVSFAVEPGEIFAVIGPNGAGKTTLFNLISGIYVPQRGRVILGDTDVTGLPPHLLARRGLSRTFQNLQVFFRMSVVENVMVGRHLHESHNVLAHLLPLPRTIGENRRTRERARDLLDVVRLADVADRPAGSLPYGALKRLEIARALATEPKLVLLDEPAAGCNPVESAEIDAVIRRVVDDGVTVVLVEHDMRMVMAISSRIHVLDGGRTLTQGDAATVSRDPAVVAAYLGNAALASEASGQRGDPKDECALASEASGQRGGSEIVRSGGREAERVGR
jgi:branched-chain amino acid transport system ATP-binding protein